jgi:hypothetical protein
LQAIVCQPQLFGGQLATQNMQLGGPLSGATQGWQAGFSVLYSTLPTGVVINGPKHGNGGDNGNGHGNELGSDRQVYQAQSTATASCVAELYETPQQAAQAASTPSLPAGSAPREVGPPSIGANTHAYQGQLSGDPASLPYAVIDWQDGRFVGRVTVQGGPPNTVNADAIMLARAMDAAMQANH